MAKLALPELDGDGGESLKACFDEHCVSRGLLPLPENQSTACPQVASRRPGVGPMLRDFATSLTDWVDKASSAEK